MASIFRGVRIDMLGLETLGILGLSVVVVVLTAGRPAAGSSREANSSNTPDTPGASLSGRVAPPSLHQKASCELHSAWNKKTSESGSR